MYRHFSFPLTAEYQLILFCVLIKVDPVSLLLLRSHLSSNLQFFLLHLKSVYLHLSKHILVLILVASADRKYYKCQHALS